MIELKQYLTKNPQIDYSIEPEEVIEVLLRYSDLLPDDKRNEFLELIRHLDVYEFYEYSPWLLESGIIPYSTSDHILYEVKDIPDNYYRQKASFLLSHMFFDILFDFDYEMSYFHITGEEYKEHLSEDKNYTIDFKAIGEIYEEEIINLCKECFDGYYHEYTYLHFIAIKTKNDINKNFDNITGYKKYIEPGINNYLFIAIEEQESNYFETYTINDLVGERKHEDSHYKDFYMLNQLVANYQNGSKLDKIISILNTKELIMF